MRAYDEVTGYELWALPLSALSTSIGTIFPSGGSFVNTDTTLRLTFPAGAVSSNTALQYEDIGTPTHPFGGGQKVVRSFTLEASSSAGAPVTQFAKPYALTLDYDESALAAAGVNEATLNLAYWDGQAWSIILPCAECGLDTVNNQMTVVLDHFTEFALFGSDQSIPSPSPSPRPSQPSQPEPIIHRTFVPAVEQ